MEHGEHCKRDLATLDEFFMRWAPRGIDLPAPLPDRDTLGLRPVNRRELRWWRNWS